MAQQQSGRARRARHERTRREAALIAPQGEVDQPADDRRPMSRSWRRIFLAVLGKTSDIDVACKAARVTRDFAFSARRVETDFAIAWRRALLEGYENLELETLLYLRTGRRPHEETPFDVANAIRLIKGQADVVARERARREDDDEQAVLDSIDRMLDRMRERAAANAALLEDGADEPG
jgi:hypothetical protein